MKILVLVMLLLDIACFAATEKTPRRLSEELEQLYVQRVIVKEKREIEGSEETEIVAIKTSFITVALGFNLYQGSLTDRELFQVNRKYRIYFSDNKKTKSNYWIEVLIGGRQQFAFYFPDEAEPLVGTIGEVVFKDDKKEFKLFVGTRDDPQFFDKDGFETFWKDFCLPTDGLRCDGSKPENYYEALNNAYIVVQLPIEFLTDSDDIDSGSFSVWAKVFEAK